MRESSRQSAHSRVSGNPAGIQAWVPAFAGTSGMKHPAAAAGSRASRARSRDNGFRVGLAETGDALRVLASPAALNPTALKPALRALFCATHSDWERFDDIFDAFWRGRDMRQRQVLSGVPSAAQAPGRRLAEAQVPQEALGLPDHVERRRGDDGETPADGRGRREGASRAEVLSATDLRHIVDPDDIAATHALAARLARVDASAAGAPRANPPPRPPARSAPHHPPQCLAWRHALRACLAPPQDQAAAARRSARCLGLDEPLHRVLRPLPARRGRRLPRGRGLRLSHPPRSCLAVAARSRRHPRRRQARADGAGHRRRHADRREPRHLQSLARAPRHQFAHRCY